MEEEKTVVDDQTVNEEQTSQETNADENESKEEPSKELQSALAQKEHFRNKYEELKAQRETKEETKTETKTQDNVKSTTDLSKIEKEINSIKFAQTHPDIAGEDVQEILDIAERKGIDAEEALKLPMVKTYLDNKKEAEKTSNAMPSNSRSPRVQASKPISEMSRDEHRKLYNETMSRL